MYRVYADDGVSGTVPLETRPDGSQILKDARLGKFDQLFVYKLDRLGRETRLILNAVAELEKLGVRVRSMTEDCKLSKEELRHSAGLKSGRSVQNAIQRLRRELRMNDLEDLIDNQYGMGYRLVMKSKGV